jgi:hypothetical protein
MPTQEYRAGAAHDLSTSDSPLVLVLLQGGERLQCEQVVQVVEADDVAQAPAVLIGDQTDRLLVQEQRRARGSRRARLPELQMKRRQSVRDPVAAL